MNRLARLTACALLGAAALLGTGVAAAQRSLGTNDWRRANREKREDAFFTVERFTFEARFGPYYPQIDEPFEGAKVKPYVTVFNNNPQFYFGFEIDWLPFRIPYVGVIGPGIGWGYTWASTTANIAQTDVESGQETSLWIMPMHASAVLRVDALKRDVGVPVVPYAKLGVGWGLWSTASGDSVDTYTDLEGNTQLGRGTSWGTHLALGGMLWLGWLDRSGSSNLKDTTGIQNLYLFGEWMNANLDGIAPSNPQEVMHVGSSSWVVGIAGDL